MYTKIIFCFGFIFLTNLNLECFASNQYDSEFEQEEIILPIIPDPNANFNRYIFDFNIYIVENIMHPVFDVYRNYVPIGIRWSLKNFGENFTITPLDMTYSIMDFDIESLTVSFWRFLLNSTIGFFGIIDIANDLGLPAYNKSLDKVFHFYNIPHGPYIMLPFLGPSTLRGGIATLFEFTLIKNPLLWYGIFGINTIFIFQPYSSFLSPFYRFGLLSDINWIYNISDSINMMTVVEGATSTIKQIGDSGINAYEWSKIGYIQFYILKMKEYDNIRYYKTIKTRNICDNDLNLLNNEKEHCQFDVKTYATSFSDEEDS